MATYAVGDLQGCLTPLQCLLREVNFGADDRLWLAGDLINRGPASLECLRFIHGMRDQVTCVLGNHDLHLIAAARGHRQPSRSDTLDEILNADDCAILIDWLCQQPLLHTDTRLGYTMVHAGIPPQWDLQQASAHAQEIQTVMQNASLDDFLGSMYGNQPAQWHDNLEGCERWRTITNYFTRMRFCNSEGVLELTAKKSQDKAPAGFAPWFAHPQRKTQQDNIIFGHWAALEGRADHERVFALDTGCVWGGAMTMMRLEDQRLYRCEC